MDPYKLMLALAGLALIGAAWLPHLLKRQPLTFPIVYVAIGIGLYSLPLQLPDPDPLQYSLVTERLTELVVLVALVGAGLRIDTPFGWRRWSVTWRLLGLTMPLCIVAGALLGLYWLGLGLASALLLGAVLAPTDPVLAADVQVGPPKSGDEDEVRFGLTSEAGLNDALAFPFVHLAILAAAGGLATQAGLTDWFSIKVGWKLLAGLGAGLLIGKVLGHLLFRSRRGLSKLADGLIALAATLITYALAEMINGYGFLAVSSAP